MKLFKKLVAVVAMAAVCLAMTAPVSAKAYVLECKHEHLRLVREYRYYTLLVYDYSYEADVDGDGELEIVSDQCKHNIFHIYEGYSCVECGEMIVDYVHVWAHTSHSEKTCPYYPYKY